MVVFIAGLLWLLDRTVDPLADTWRWWAAPGALIGCLLLAPRASVLMKALWRLHRMRREGIDIGPDFEVETSTVLTPGMRLTTTLCALALMVFVMVAGVMIPLANDGRLANFTRETLLYRSTFAGLWLMAGTACWGIALSLAPHWRWLLASSIACWCAAFFAQRALEGALV